MKHVKLLVAILYASAIQQSTGDYSFDQFETALHLSWNSEIYLEIAFILEFWHSLFSNFKT